MSNNQLQPSTFAHEVDAYLRYHRALGLRYRGVEHVLSNLGRYLELNSARDLDDLFYEGWRRARVELHSNSRRKAEQIVRRFCLYRRRTNLEFFVPSADAFSCLRPYVRPVIVEPGQIAQMLAAADRLAPHKTSPLHPAVARIATVLLYTAGLRSGEVRRLCVEDIEDNGSLLQIRESKFHKSRLVPLSESAQVEVQRYLCRRATFAVGSSDQGPFLCNRSRGVIRAYSAPGFQSLIQRLFKLAAVVDGEGRVPRIHDLRHSFAVQNLIHAYRTQGDPQALLPKLSLYLGHVSIESTVHYLKLVPAVATLACSRFDAAFGQQVLGE
ncbi:MULTISPECIES: tyrosine-type recombinase/integrase [unclassified Burkholderia]|uniref:tyrosine-type recombinase/integrase n=1 Tax=unclassified Burkholderia TaxID=2613784 RepID=UPI00119BB38D|nr:MULTISPECIES: tyrosine-type recombinase/integrase [unclassified Burkholderia]TWC56416.1 site-specific recombinase XerD [Burkholderia sp. SJZ089]TWC92128.1 site-specific recombinase XerD [Burkholderia sp. SJZ115]TWC94839.1 site-specific recombinase XerD [Burkholderia sp. SJZ091]